MYKVTKEHIEKGSKSDSRACPLALCLREHIEEQVAVSRRALYCRVPLTEWAKTQKLSFYTFSEALVAWIMNFDLGKEVPEISIYVDKDKFFIEDKNN